jgi:hypothetical protein
MAAWNCCSPMREALDIAATADYVTSNALKRQRQLPVHLETWRPRNDAIGELGGAQIYALPDDKNNIVMLPLQDLGSLMV